MTATAPEALDLQRAAREHLWLHFSRLAGFRDGEVPIIVYLADRRETVVISGQGTAPARASREVFARQGSIPSNGPLAGTVPAVVDALAIALAEYGTRSLGETLAPAIELADGFAWYEFLTRYLEPELPKTLDNFADRLEMVHWVRHLTIAQDRSRAGDRRTSSSA